MADYHNRLTNNYSELLFGIQVKNIEDEETMFAKQAKDITKKVMTKPQGLSTADKEQMESLVDQLKFGTDSSVMAHISVQDQTTSANEVHKVLSTLKHKDESD